MKKIALLLLALTALGFCKHPYLECKVDSKYDTVYVFCSGEPRFDKRIEKHNIEVSKRGDYLDWEVYWSDGSFSHEILKLENGTMKHSRIYIDEYGVTSRQELRDKQYKTPFDAWIQIRSTLEF